MAASPSAPLTRPDVVDRPGSGSGALHPWSVILHNDDHNEMLYVVQSLVRCVPTLTQAAAFTIMLAAHNNGRALVTTCPLELAELYRDRLESRGLTATIERGGD